MIEYGEALSQIERLCGLDKYPKGPGSQRAIDELVKAGRTSHNEAVMALVADEWLANERFAPKPADLRARIWEKNQKFKRKEPPCQLCGGAGFTTEYHAVEFEGNSYRVKSSFRLNVANEEQATKLAPLHEIRTAARLCSCRPVPIEEAS